DVIAGQVASSRGVIAEPLLAEDPDVDGLHVALLLLREIPTYPAVGEKPRFRAGRRRHATQLRIALVDGVGHKLVGTPTMVHLPSVSTPISATTQASGCRANSGTGEPRLPRFATRSLTKFRIPSYSCSVLGS